MQGLFANRRTKHAAWFLVTAMPLLLAAYMVFQHYRPPLKFGDERTWVDIVIMNSDVALALFFLIVSFVPFILIFGRKPQARDMVPIAVMAALGVVGRTVFAIVPLPNFKPVSAIVIMTGVVFGPESGFLTGALTGFVSNFIFGQGPWTPWQMFSWGMIGLSQDSCRTQAHLEKYRPQERSGKMSSRRPYGTGSFRNIRSAATFSPMPEASPDGHL